ncbi:hypothetical protein LNQ03_05030 [Klebsiella pneumoniae subsp. pneumoniae]|nr:hypothetical protein [Klebsiella pneumoniae subsp. pneumoniae]
MKNIVVPVDVFDAGLADKALSHANSSPNILPGKFILSICYSGLFSCINPRIYLDARKMEDHLLNTAKEKLS